MGKGNDLEDHKDGKIQVNTWERNNCLGERWEIKLASQIVLKKTKNMQVFN